MCIRDSKEAATEELRMESEELTLEVDNAEDYEDLLTEDAAEELEEEDVYKRQILR